MYLLYISKNTIEIFKKYQKVGELTWTPETFSKTLSQIKSNFSSKFRIILSDYFINVSSLLLPPNETRKRAEIQSKFQPLITENLYQTIWDYKIVAKYNRFNLVQIIFVSSKFFDIFRLAVQSAGIKVCLLESFSTTICRFLPKNKLIMLNYQDLLILSFNQTPIYSHLLDKKLSQSDINQVFEFSQKHFQTLPQQILFSPAGDIAFNQFDFSDLRPEYTNVNPLKGIIHSSNALGTDSETSRLDVVKINKKPSSFLPKIMVAIPLVLLLIIFIFVLKHNVNNSDSVVDSITPTIIATPTEIPLSSIKIQILNGTGTTGEATKVTALLTKNDFKVESVGNAANYDFIQTQIETKNSTPDSIINLVKESLKDGYPAKVSETNLPESSEFDIVITTGK
jgi:hypothetical protein